ncbi:MAG: metalloregulator ArsR/SmtB family transcription factor [Thermoanaerobaculia bacterium]
MNARPSILDHAAILAEITRCRILRLLDRHELTVSELGSVLQQPQSTTSRHLKVLADGGWVHSRREGTSHLYRSAANSVAGDGVEPSAARLWMLIREELDGTAAARQDRRRLESVLRERRSRSQEFFTSAAHEWDQMRDELFGRRFDLLALPGLFDRRWVVGDLGCGTGRISEALAPFVARVVAVDGSATMLEAARERLARFDNVDLRESELERLPIADQRLDAATLVLALHHLPEPVAALNEARRVLKPGGRLLVADMLPHDREEYRQQMGHVWLGFSEEQTRRSFEAAGFHGVRLQALPAEPEAKGPTLFVATAHTPSKDRAAAVERLAVAAAS